MGQKAHVQEGAMAESTCRVHPAEAGTLTCPRGSPGPSPLPPTLGRHPLCTHTACNTRHCANIWACLHCASKHMGMPAPCKQMACMRVCGQTPQSRCSRDRDRLQRFCGRQALAGVFLHVRWSFLWIPQMQAGLIQALART